MVREIQKEEVLAKNPSVDQEALKEFERLDEELKKMDIEIKPRYLIEPPLGGNQSRLFSIRY